MKRLYILRHAKSSWAQPGLGDVERPLNQRGIRQAKQLNRWFAEQAFHTEKVLCSPSARTQQTHQYMAGALENAAFEIVPQLYNGMVDVYLEALWMQEYDSIMLIGHNPTCDELSRFLSAPGSPAAGKLMAHHFGTATLAIFEIETDSWTNLARGCGQLTRLIRPKDLENSLRQ